MNYEMNLNNEFVTTINLDNAHENNIVELTKEDNLADYKKNEISKQDIGQYFKNENNNQLKSSTEHTIYVYKLELTADLKIQKIKIKEFKTAKSHQK